VQSGHVDRVPLVLGHAGEDTRLFEAGQKLPDDEVGAEISPRLDRYFGPVASEMTR
jgi:hypothetical protein